MSEGWLALERELDALLALPEAERAPRLAALAQRDACAAAQLQAWLDAIARSQGFLEPASAAPAPQAGRALGPWRLLRPLGAGGMGEVWLAERTDGAFAKQVAIKFIRYDDAPLRERFARECQVLARLEHPGIARLIDAGVADGQPYLVTEFVDGLPLDRWCERQQPDLKRRLALFAAIVPAVTYAHANLVVHRDLKPANVLIDGDGRPRLLDFGIAKLLGAAPDGETQHAALTPPFAAPEQVQGGAITTRTDVYALGAMLYWLLTGRVPLETAGLPMAAWVQRVCHEAPPPPSRVGQLAEVERHVLRGDLDAIVLKALAKNPAERYASAEALAADLERAAHLRPVHARRPTRFYRARRLLRRHWLASATAAAFVLAIGAGLAGTIWQARIATRERDAALTQARRNGIAYDFMQRLFAAYAGAPQKLGVDELVQRAEDAVRRDQGSDRRDTALAVLGEVQYLRGDHRAAAAILEPLLRNPTSGLSDAERYRAQCQLAASLGALGEHAEARTWLDAAQRENPGLYSADRGGLLACRIVQSYLLRRSDDLAGAIANDRSALAELRANPDADRNLLAEAHANLGFSLGLFGRYRDSIAEFEQAVAQYRELGRGDSEDVASALAGIGNSQMRAGLVREAQRSFGDAIALHRRTNGPSTWLAETLVHAAQLEDTLGNAAPARTLLDEAQAILAQQSQPGSQQHTLLLFERARNAYVANDAAAARAAQSAVERELGAHFPRQHFFYDLAALSDAFVRLCGEPGTADFAAARVSVERAIAGMRAHATMRRLLPAALVQSARIALHERRSADAGAALREARTLIAANDDPASWQLAYCDALLGVAQLAADEAEAGRAAVRDALPRLRAELGAQEARVREIEGWLDAGKPAAVSAR